MDTVSSSQKVVPMVLGHRFRAARRYYFNNEDSSPMLIASTRSIQQHVSSPQILDNPLVVAAFLAGIIGVTIMVVIVIGVYIKAKLTKSSSSTTKQSQRHSNNGNSDCCRESTIMSSLSTLNEGNETQYETIQLNDTADFAEELEAVVIEDSAASPAQSDVEIVISIPSHLSDDDTGPTSSL